MMYFDSRESPLPQGEARELVGSEGSYWESWFTTYNRRISRLRALKQANYWQQWTTDYTQTSGIPARQTHAGVEV
ncbi:hypothetical protein BST81_19780 [Leptolyngbya sp. 'hensonii']|uniref:hypothetical protein n=1 Tax=Leptolyngbya sp. 'hensonii' TaxID=1922337 RepID=UPI00094F6285|nr:hypothetical protein [Leptolyngbya sp. 'hensonii']OLP16680.1 hypothetical protein BST81_19780 [Leptolyngbya sp. 'hensonii']